MLSLILASAFLAAINAVDWNSTIRRAMALADITMKAACEDMKISRGHFERQLNGEGHLSLKRLGKLGPRFLSCLAVVLAHRFGIPEEFATVRALEEATAYHERRSA